MNELVFNLIFRIRATVSGPTVKQLVGGGHYSSYIGIKQRRNLTAAEIL